MDQLPFENLDFLYMPAAEVGVEAANLVDVLGGRIVFAVADGGTRVAMVALTDDPPHILLTDHLHGERPILIYRVRALVDIVEALERAGWEKGEVFEIPHGPCVSFRTPQGLRMAVYEPVRPDATSFFAGRKDF